MATAKTQNFTAYEFNAVTGEGIIRELSAEEIAELNLLAETAAQKKAAEEAKAAARQSALAKLAELGLTEEEIAAL